MKIRNREGLLRAELMSPTGRDIDTVEADLAALARKKDAVKAQNPKKRFFGLF
jgi:hypothetical protein